MTIQLRRGTAAQWTSKNPILAVGEPGFETDTGRQKVGDGASPWSALQYFIREDQIADSVGATTSAIGAALARIYPATSDTRQAFGNSQVWLGDSLTQWFDAATPVNANAPLSAASHSQRVSLGNLGSIISKQRGLYVNNAGVGGNNTAQMLARFDTDVTPYAPKVVHLLGGTNDQSYSWPTSTTLDNIATIIDKIRAIGATPILGTIPPRNNKITDSAILAMALRRFALTEGVPLVDYYAVLVDPATGGFLDEYYRDGLHPNDAGYVAMATAYAAVAANVLPPHPGFLPLTAGVSGNLLSNGLWPDAGAPWVNTGGAIVAGADGDVGNWMTLTGSASPASVYQDVATAPVSGHRYAVTSRVRTTWSSGADAFTVSNRIAVGSGTVDMMPIDRVSVNIDDGVLYCEYVCPPGAVSQRVSVEVAANVTGTLAVAQTALYDLTALGLV